MSGAQELKKIEAIRARRVEEIKDFDKVKKLLRAGLKEYPLWSDFVSLQIYKMEHQEKDFEMADKMFKMAQEAGILDRIREDD